MKRADAISLGRTLLSDAVGDLPGRWNPWHSLNISLAMLEWERLGYDGVDPVRYFRMALEGLPDLGTLPPWLYGGVAQIGWLALHLHRVKGLRIKNLASIDDYIIARLESYPPDADIELLRGILGLGIYGLRHVCDPVRHKIISGVLAELDVRLETTESGAFVRLADPRWARPETTGEIGWRSVGVAHGNAGVAAFLALAARGAPGSGEVAQRMLGQVAEWLTTVRLPRDDVAYPAYAEQPASRHRSSWCHGDPGISLALFQLRDALEDDRLRARVQTCARHAAWVSLGQPQSESGVVDCCLCHGAAFLCYFGSKSPELPLGAAREYASRWMDYIGRSRARGPLLYRGASGFARDISFLNGDCGVACALWRSVSGTRACWEDMLLMG